MKVPDFRAWRSLNESLDMGDMLDKVGEEIRPHKALLKALAQLAKKQGRSDVAGLISAAKGIMATDRNEWWIDLGMTDEDTGIELGIGIHMF